MLDYLMISISLFSNRKMRGIPVSAVSMEMKGDIAVLRVNNPPVNALSYSVRSGLAENITALQDDDRIKVAVIICEGRTFMAGADIKEFGRPLQEPGLPDVVDMIEASNKPVVAAIHGTALGGGLEVAISCHHRIALSSAKIGLPEVKLGILPGAGGTQRLPRLAGVENSLDAILSGRHVGMSEASVWGVVDKVVEDDLLEAALEFAGTLNADDIRRTGDIELDKGKYDDAFFAGFRKSIARKTKGYFAPERCVQCVEASVNLDFKAGLKRERELFIECQSNPQARALQHMFFAERQISRIPGITKETPRLSIKKVGIIGAGTMGGGIAMNFANAGIATTVLELEQAALERGLGVVRRNYENTMKKGRLTEAQVEERMGLLTGTLSYDDLSDCDLIIEAVFEKMEIKKIVFEKLDEVAKEGAILASNTSYLNIDEIASFTKRPDYVLGLHFFSPANVMRLLEIVRGAKTDVSVLATCVDLAKKIRKVGVVAGVCHGFIGNRMLSPYFREASLAVIEGASPEAVDKVLLDFGMPMGPMAVSDMAGLDIGYMNRQSLGRENYETVAFDWMDRIVDMGRKGLKTGAGVYAYDEGSRVPKPDPEIAKLIEEEAEKAGITRRNVSDDEILERSMLALINEGAKILGEGMAYRASDIDIVYCNGYGYPPYRGGPMHYADYMGIDKVYEKLCALRDKKGPRWWEPAPLIEKLAKAGNSFADYDRQNAQ
jgi:3-hydroxyacyl-CoA dehydrogenase